MHGFVVFHSAICYAAGNSIILRKQGTTFTRKSMLHYLTTLAAPLTYGTLACASRTARPSGAGRMVRSDKRGSLRSQGRPERVLARIYVVRFAHRAGRTVFSEVIIEVMDFKESRMAMKIVQNDDN